MTSLVKLNKRGKLVKVTLCERIQNELFRAYPSTMSLDSLMSAFPKVHRSTIRGRLSEMVRAGRITKTTLGRYKADVN